MPEVIINPLWAVYGFKVNLNDPNLDEIVREYNLICYYLSLNKYESVEYILGNYTYEQVLEYAKAWTAHQYVLMKGGNQSSDA